MEEGYVHTNSNFKIQRERRRETDTQIKIQTENKKGWETRYAKQREAVDKISSELAKQPIPDPQLGDSKGVGVS